MTATSVSIDRFATAGKPPAPIAPGAGASGNAQPFGQQLEDARDSAGRRSDARPAATSQTEDEPASHVKGQRAAARSTEKKDPDKGVAATAATAATPPPALPFSLSLPLVITQPGAGGAAQPAGDSRHTSGRIAQAPDQSGGAPVDGAPADGAQQDPSPDPVAGDSASQTITADLTFALKLNSQAPGAADNAQGQTPSGAETPIPAGVQAAASGQTQDQPQNSAGTGKGNTRPAQDGISVRLNTIPKDAAAAVTPVKEGHQSDAGQDAAQPGPRNNTLNIQTAATSVPAKASANSTVSPPPSSNQPAHLNAAAKALDATPIQAPTSDQTAKTPGPLKDLAIQVGQTPHDKVELRVVDRAGEVQVAVRASNPDLAQGLRQGLSDLVDRLEQNGFRAEAWRPGTTAAPAAGITDARQKPAQFQNQGWQSPSGGSQQGRQQNGQNQSRPRWVQELEGSLTGGQSSFQGESYGISR